jgi:adenosylmethionine-8-amino-7-oxononanoate aminotransferase
MSTVSNGDAIIIAPPYNASDIELDELVSKLARGVAGALSRS